MRDDWVYLVQTDTTAGFLSKDKEKLAAIKNRSPNKPILKVVSSFQKLQKIVRVPKAFQKEVRRSTRTTFVYPNHEAVRVVYEKNHKRFVKQFDWLYSTSANKHGCGFERDFALKMCDVSVEDERGFFEGQASKIVQISKYKKRRLR